MQVNCPTCQTLVTWSSDSEFRPFCSKKCQLIDLGEWANEEKAIACEPQKEQAPSAMDIEEIEAMLAEQQDDFFNS